jgi:hypothetical protein
MSNENPTLAEVLRGALPEEHLSEEARQAIEQVAELETRHAESTRRAELERRFLERAPREGLLHPGDALKLADIPNRLGDAEDPGNALDELYQELRTERPYLFRKPPAAPEKLTRPVNEKIRESWNGAGLTRQLMMRRRK